MKNSNNQWAVKYRPFRPTQIIGQDHALAVMKSWLVKDKFPHTILISGPYGTGKTSLAFLFAATVNGIDPRKVEDSPDIIDLNAANHRGIEEVRNLVRNASHLPVQGRYRIYILDEAHRFTSDSASLLLKFTEKPPAHVMIIFCTSHPEKMTAGLLASGRCVTINLNKVSYSNIIDILLPIAEMEEVLQPAQKYQQVYQAIAEDSNGVPRVAIAMLQSIAGMLGDNDPTPEVAQQALIAAHKSLPELYMPKLCALTLMGIYLNNIPQIIKCANEAQGSVDFYITRLLDMNNWLLNTVIAGKFSGSLDQKALINNLSKHKKLDIPKIITIQNYLCDLREESKNYLIDADILAVARLTKMALGMINW